MHADYEAGSQQAIEQFHARLQEVANRQREACLDLLMRHMGDELEELHKPAPSPLWRRAGRWIRQAIAPAQPHVLPALDIPVTPPDERKVIVIEGDYRVVGRANDWRGQKARAGTGRRGGDDGDRGHDAGPHDDQPEGKCGGNDHGGRDDLDHAGEGGTKDGDNRHNGREESGK